ncbi:MAG: hypothetical protein PHN75_11855 [Syntrophales bacterium]|nr:hypothetical protein [Syntrophales bacterium]
MLVCVFDAIRLAHVCSNFSRLRLKFAALDSDVDEVELLLPSVELIDCTSCSSCANELLALVRSPDERASPSVLRSLINELESLVELVDVADVVVCEFSEALASGGGGGPICCII